jgi:hypothetical protein
MVQWIPVRIPPSLLVLPGITFLDIVNDLHVYIYACIRLFPTSAYL